MKVLFIKGKFLEENEVLVISVVIIIIIGFIIIIISR